MFLTYIGCQYVVRMNTILKYQLQHPRFPKIDSLLLFKLENQWNQNYSVIHMTIFVACDYVCSYLVCSPRHQVKLNAWRSKHLRCFDTFIAFIVGLDL